MALPVLHRAGEGEGLHRVHGARELRGGNDQGEWDAREGGEPVTRQKEKGYRVLGRGALSLGEALDCSLTLCGLSSDR